MSNDYIPLCVPYLLADDAKSVSNAVETGWVSSAGPDIQKFENSFVDKFNFSSVTACSSGTSALHLALLSLDIKDNDEVIVPDITFVATVNAIRYVNAIPVVLDIDPSTLGLCPKSVRNFINENCIINEDELINKKSGNKVRAIMPVHMLGTPAALDELLEIASQYKLKIIEDATEALGSKYKGKYIGEHGTIACFSFNGNKMITTGGGGLVVSDDKALVQKSKHLATTAKTDPVFFEHDMVGFNYRLTNLQASLGVSQMQKFDEIFSNKQRIHNVYKSYFKDNEDVSLHEEPSNSVSNHWLNAIKLSQSVLSKFNLREFISLLDEDGIQARPLWTRISKLEMFKNYSYGALSNSEEIHRQTICLPSSACLTDIELEKIATCVAKICSK